MKTDFLLLSYLICGAVYCAIFFYQARKEIASLCDKRDPAVCVIGLSVAAVVISCSWIFYALKNWIKIVLNK